MITYTVGSEIRFAEDPNPFTVQAMSPSGRWVACTRPWSEWDRETASDELAEYYYVLLHRMITGFTARRLWERCAVHATLAAHPDMPMKRIAHALHLSTDEAQRIADAGPGWLDEVRQVAPEEFLDWIDDTIRDLTERARGVLEVAEDWWIAVRDMPRREAAQAIQSFPYRGLVFSLLDGKPITAQCWAAIYPDHEVPFMNRTEDAA